MPSRLPSQRKCFAGYWLLATGYWVLKRKGEKHHVRTHRNSDHRRACPALCSSAGHYVAGDQLARHVSAHLALGVAESRLHRKRRQPANTPTIKGFTPDEEATEVYDVLEKQKAEISTVLWEATFENYKTLIAAGVVTDDGAVRAVHVGGLALNYSMIGFQGPAPVSDSMSSPASLPQGRVIIMQKAIVTSAISLNMSRAEIQKFSVKFDARKISEQDLYDLYEFYLP